MDKALRLASKLTLVLAVASAAPLLLGVGLTLPRARVALRHQLDTFFKQSARQLADLEDRFLQEKIDSLALTASSLELASLDDEAREQALLLVWRQTRNADLVALFDAKGDAVVNPVSFSDLPADSLQDHDLVSAAGRDAFAHNVPLAEALKGYPVVGPVYATPGGRPKVVITMTVAGARHETWVLAVEISLALMARELEDFRVGQTGGAFLIDANGKTIAGRRLSQRSRELEPGEVGSTATLPTTGWTVLVEQDADEALEPIHQQTRAAVLWIAFGLVLALTIGFTAVRAVTGPLRRLSAASGEVAGGVLDHELVIRGSDEIADLGRDFNGMTRALGERLRQLEEHGREIEQLNDELRRQISERSRDLSEALARVTTGAAPAAPSAGDVVGDRYQVVRTLGEGGMGRVYEVERITDGRHLALKVLSRGQTGDGLARFAREAQLTAHLAHPNIVSIVDVQLSKTGIMYLVMELVPGASLEALRPRFGNVPWSLTIIRQVAEGLAAVHAQGIVHRDLKPANILVDLVSDGPPQVKIVDFGVASLAQRAEPDTEATAMTAEQILPSMVTAPVTPPAGTTAPGTGPMPHLTQAGAIIGTPMYIAPELAKGMRVAAPPADVFSLGVIAFELLSGSQPFKQPAIIQRVAARSLVSAALAPAVSNLVDRCLSMAPADRPTAAEIVAALRDAPEPTTSSTVTMASIVKGLAGEPTKPVS